MHNCDDLCVITYSQLHAYYPQTNTANDATLIQQVCAGWESTTAALLDIQSSSISLHLFHRALVDYGIRNFLPVN